MDNGRLQEIKDYSQFVDECEYPESIDVIEVMHRYLKELITALEASQIAADAAKLFMEKAETERDEAQAEVERLRAENAAIEEHIAEHGVIRRCLRRIDK